MLAMTTQTISYQEVVDVVMTLPEDRLVSVYSWFGHLASRSGEFLGQLAIDIDWEVQ